MRFVCGGLRMQEISGYSIAAGKLNGEREKVRKDISAAITSRCVMAVVFLISPASVTGTVVARSGLYIKCASVDNYIG
jgi:hypothetical protein